MDLAADAQAVARQQVISAFSSNRSIECNRGDKQSVVCWAIVQWQRGRYAKRLAAYVFEVFTVYPRGIKKNGLL